MVCGHSFSDLQVPANSEVQSVHGTRPQLITTAVFKCLRVAIWLPRGAEHAQAQWTDTTYLKGIHLSASLALCILLLLQ